MEATQEAETNEHPHRRLNVVPTRICTTCVHHHRAHVYGGWNAVCQAGDSVTSPVTGDKTYVTLCEKKNGDGECAAYVEIDYDGIAAKRSREARSAAMWMFAILIIATAVLYFTYPGRGTP